MVFRVWARVYDRVDTDAVAACRFEGLISDLAGLDPVWSGPWSCRLMKQSERVIVPADQAGFEELFRISRDDQGYIPSASFIHFVVSTPYGASIAATPVLTMPAYPVPSKDGTLTQLSFDIRPKPILAQAGLTTRATTGAVGLALFDAVLRWFEPTSFYYVTKQADQIATAVSQRLGKFTTYRKIDQETISHFAMTSVGWLNLIETHTPLDSTLLPENAVTSIEPRSGGTIVRLGDSPWTVTDDQFHALRAAVGLVHPDQIVDTNGLTDKEIIALKPPYW